MHTEFQVMVCMHLSLGAGKAVTHCLDRENFVHSVWLTLVLFSDIIAHHHFFFFFLIAPVSSLWKDLLCALSCSRIGYWGRCSFKMLFWNPLHFRIFRGLGIILHVSQKFLLTYLLTSVNVTF